MLPLFTKTACALLMLELLSRIRQFSRDPMMITGRVSGMAGLPRCLPWGRNAKSAGLPDEDLADEGLLADDERDEEERELAAKAGRPVPLLDEDDEGFPSLLAIRTLSTI